MSEPQGSAITQELSLGDIFSRTFNIYRRFFVPNFILFLIAEVIIGAVTTGAGALINTSVNTGATGVAVFSSLGGVLEAAAISLIVTIIVWPIAFGASIKMASDEINMSKPDLMPSARFAVSKFVSIFLALLVVFIIVGIGFALIIVPGIILGIMFCMAIPSVVLENKGVIESLGRSRQLVGGRWLKTFAFGIVLFIIIIVASVILGIIAGLFGPGSNFVSHVLSALYYPLVPISLTVYFYSNVARLSPQAMGPMGQPMAPGTIPPAPGTMRFCPNCGTQVAAGTVFCPNCGAKMPT